MFVPDSGLSVSPCKAPIVWILKLRACDTKPEIGHIQGSKPEQVPVQLLSLNQEYFSLSIVINDQEYSIFSKPSLNMYFLKRGTIHK